MTKKKTLISERVVRRWGALANMAPMTENWLQEQDPLEDEEAAAEDEIAAGEAEVEAGQEAEASVEEQETVERIVSAVVDAIADETGVAIEVEGEAGDEEAMDDMDVGMDVSDELDDEADDEMDLADEAGNRGPYNRRDIDETKKGDKIKTGKTKGEKAYEDPSKGEKITKGKDKGEEAYKGPSKGEERKGERGKKGARKAYDESLDLDVIDDEHLTEAVLKRVVERLLRRK